MNVLCYMQPQRGGGVARHASEMVNGLLHRPGVTGQILASGPDLRRHPAFPGMFPDIPIRTHPLPGRWLERAWKLCGWPPLRHRCRGFDLVYSPAEVRLPDCGIPSLVTVHDVQALEQDLPWSGTREHVAFRTKWLRWLPTMIQEASRILTVSEFSKQRMVALLNADADKIVVIGNGVSSEFTRPAPAAAPQPVLVVIGGLRLKKGAAATLQVAAELARRRLPFVIEVFGQHDPEWVEAARGHANVRLHGYAADAEIAGRLRQATALLFLSPYEGFGIPAVEAMAVGTPAIVANAAALPEVVGGAGILVEPDDTPRIADLIERLADDRAFHASWVAAGHDRARQYTWDRCVDRLVAAVREVRP